MKTTPASNWRPLLRAFYAFLIAFAALWAMPRNARAQLYVTQDSGGTSFVSEYGTKTGEVINASFIPGLNLPRGLAVKGNPLFVSNLGTNAVGKYDATTGAAINATFITGLDQPVGLAVLGNTLFVANFGTPATVGTTVGDTTPKRVR
jgi:DNA-binding beta-propeller fold protein YncE